MKAALCTVLGGEACCPEPNALALALTRPLFSGFTTRYHKCVVISHKPIQNTKENIEFINAIHAALDQNIHTWLRLR